MSEVPLCLQVRGGDLRVPTRAMVRRRGLQALVRRQNPGPVRARVNLVGILLPRGGMGAHRPRRAVNKVSSSLFAKFLPRSLPIKFLPRSSPRIKFLPRYFQDSVCLSLPGRGCKGVPRSKEPPPPLDPAVALWLGTYGDPGGLGGFYERGTPVRNEQSG